MKQHILLIYHFFYPDEVVSSRLFSELAQSLVEHEYKVTVYTSNKFIRGNVSLPVREEWNGVNIRRFSRTGFAQSSNWGRLINSAFLQLKWIRRFWEDRKEYDAVIVGTDPQFAYMMFPFLRLINRNVKRVHWAFDLYPEAIIASSPKWMKVLASLIRPFVPWAYRNVDLMVDIGSCMRERLKQYKSHAKTVTLTPWSLVEPVCIPVANKEIRKDLFGDAKLALLYSGTIGFASNLIPFVKLARECRKRKLDVAFCFTGHGNRYEILTKQITPEDTNIRLAGFASEEELEKRLSAADIHLISVRKEWGGIVIPSKFFGSIACGRPLLYSGAPNSAIREWIENNKVGLILSERNLSEIVNHLEELSHDRSKLVEMQKRAFSLYHREYSKTIIGNRWETTLHKLLRVDAIPLNNTQDISVGKK